MLHLPIRLLAAALVAVLAFPTAALLAPGLLAPPALPEQPRNGPPVYGPDGIGVFPSEGSLGTHGCATPTKVADVLAGVLPVGVAVCLENALVTKADPRNRTRLFRLQAADGSELEAEVSQRWWAHGTPAVGMVVVVEGTLAHNSSGGWRVRPIARWVDLTHPGVAVDAWHVSAGLIPEGTYVWVNRTTVMAVWRNNDGPNNIGDDHVETGTVCPSAHLTTETVPELFGIVTAPPIGATIRVYGATRYDDGHEWWEVHPIRAWEVLPSDMALADCPERLGESGIPPPGIPRCPLEPLPLPIPKPDVCLPILQEAR